MKDFIKGEKYTEQEYIELSILEMRKSISEHKDKADPKVGAVLVDQNGSYFDKAHRGELRLGDHGEFTVIERKNPGIDLTGFTIYTTLEPCVKRSIPKKGCTYRILNARIKKVVIGHADPDPTVATNGIKILKSEGVEIDFYNKKYEKIIAQENLQFFNEASERAQKSLEDELTLAIEPLEIELIDYDLNDLSEEAQRLMIDQMNLKYEIGSKAFLNYLNRMNFVNIDKETKIARPTGLGILMLGKDPALQLPQARIKFTIRNGENDPIIKDFEGALVSLPNKIEEYLEFVFPKGFSRSAFKRDEQAEVSATAVLEVIMNAIVHRDYSIDGARIMINIDNEKIEVFSPGVPLCSLEKLNSYSAPSVSRNPKIAYTFFKMGYVEERGFGLEELSKLENYGLPKPTFELNDNVLKATLFRNVQNNKTSVQKSDLLGLNILKEHKRLSTAEYVEITKIPERTSRRHLNNLVTNDLALKDGKYFVLIE